MKIILNIYSIGLFLILLAFSCAKYAAPGSKQDLEDRRTKKEIRYNLLNLPGDQDIVTAEVKPVDDTVRTQSDQINFPQIEKQDESFELFFSVQVFASKSFEEAEKFESDIFAMFDEPVRTDYKAPYYKVRVGECATIEEGEALLDKVKQLGIKNAWLVRVKNWEPASEEVDEIEEPE